MSVALDPQTLPPGNHYEYPEGLIPRKRSTKIDVEFTGPHGNAAGWFFAVPEAFKDTLDIKYVERLVKVPGQKGGKGKAVMAWTQGHPSQYTFDRGHVFYDHPASRALPWGEVVGRIRYSVQVLDAAPDESLELKVRKIEVSKTGKVTEKQVAKTFISPGSVSFEFRRYNDGQVVERTPYGSTQAEFAQFLKTGKFKNTLDLTTEG